MYVGAVHQAIITSVIEELLGPGPVGIWSPKSSTFSGSDSIVVEEAARKFLSPRPSINKSSEANSSHQNDEV